MLISTRRRSNSIGDRMISMNTTFVNQELEAAAKRMLTHIAGSEDTLKPLYLQPDRALFLAENTGIVCKVYITRKALQRDYLMADKTSNMCVAIQEVPGFETHRAGVLAI